MPSYRLSQLASNQQVKAATIKKRKKKIGAWSIGRDPVLKITISNGDHLSIFLVEQRTTAVQTLLPVQINRQNAFCTEFIYILSRL